MDSRRGFLSIELGLSRRGRRATRLQALALGRHGQSGDGHGLPAQRDTAPRDGVGPKLRGGGTMIGSYGGGGGGGRSRMSMGGPLGFVMLQYATSQIGFSWQRSSKLRYIERPQTRGTAPVRIADRIVRATQCRIRGLNVSARQFASTDWNAAETAASSSGSMQPHSPRLTDGTDKKASNTTGRMRGPRIESGSLLGPSETY